MSQCSKCEQLPDPLPDEATLFITPPLDHTRVTLEEVFDEHGIDLKRDDDKEIDYADVTEDDYESLADDIDRELSSEELSDTRCILMGSNETPGVRDFANMCTLEELIGRFQGTWLVELLRDKKFTSYFHPIVKADDPGSVYGYEALLRGQGPNDTIISPGKLFPTADRMNLMFNLDREARIFAIREAARHDFNQRIFINFNPASIYDPAYCLRTTLEVIEDLNIKPEQVVFEVVESEQVADREKLLDILDHYRENGFQVALDDVGEGYSSLGMLNQLKPDYIKIDMGLVQGISEDSFKASITQNLLDLANDLDIDVIAEGVESREDLDWFQRRKADYLQGFFFAEPDSPPPPVEVPQVSKP